MSEQALVPRPIAWLGAADGGAALLGGKAASIDRLARMGLRTPPGFCITTAAFRRQLLDGPIGERAGAAMAALPDERARATLVSLATGAPLAPELAAALSAALDRLERETGDQGMLDPSRLAVRSSAIGEDSASASFAGMHDTELGVVRDGVEGAVRRCWASLWSERAIGYRRMRNLPLDGGAMAVAVQALVPATAAAVVFTRHPVTGSADQLLVNAVVGLGDTIVSGDITPDMYVLDKATLSVREQQLADETGARALDDAQLDALALLSLEIEERFRQPVDIELALAGAGWYVLQARPITTPEVRA